MLEVTITSDVLREQKYTSKTTGQPGVLFFQTGYLHTVAEDGTPSPFPEKTEFIAERAGGNGAPQAYKAGKYTLHPSAVYIDRNGRLAATMRLTPLKRPG